MEQDSIGKGKGSFSLSSSSQGTSQSSSLTSMVFRKLVLHPNFVIHMVCIVLSLSTGIMFFRSTDGDNRFILELINASIIIAFIVCEFFNSHRVKFCLCLAWLVNQSSSRVYSNPSPIFLSSQARMVLSILYLRQLNKEFPFCKQILLNVLGSIMFITVGIAVDGSYLDSFVVLYVVVFSFLTFRQLHLNECESSSNNNNSDSVVSRQLHENTLHYEQHQQQQQQQQQQQHHHHHHHCHNYNHRQDASETYDLKPTNNTCNPNKMHQLLTHQQHHVNHSNHHQNKVESCRCATCYCTSFGYGYKEKQAHPTISESKATHARVINEYLLAKSAKSGKVILKMSYEKESETLLQSIASYDPVSMRLLKANNISKMLKRFEQSKFKPILPVESAAGDTYDDIMRKQLEQQSYQSSENLDYWIRRAAAQIIQMKESEDVPSHMHESSNNNNNNNNQQNENNYNNNNEKDNQQDSFNMEQQQEANAEPYNNKYTEKVCDSKQLPSSSKSIMRESSNHNLIVSNSAGGGSASAQNSTLPYSSNLPQIGSTNNQNIDQFNSIMENNHNNGYTPVMMASPKSFIGSQTNMLSMTFHNQNYINNNNNNPNNHNSQSPRVDDLAIGTPGRNGGGDRLPIQLQSDEKLSMQCISQRFLSDNIGFSSPRNALKSSRGGVVEEYFNNKQSQNQHSQSKKLSQKSQQSNSKSDNVNVKDGRQQSNSYSQGQQQQQQQQQLTGGIATRNEEEELQQLSRREFIIERFEGLLDVSSSSSKKKPAKKRNKEREVSIGACIDGQAIYVVVEISKVSDRLPKKLSELRVVLAQYETLYQESLTCLKNMCHEVYLEIPTTGSSWRQFFSEDDEEKSDASALFASDNQGDDDTTERAAAATTAAAATAATAAVIVDRNNNNNNINNNFFHSHSHGHTHHHMISNIVVGSGSGSGNLMSVSPAGTIGNSLGGILSAERKSGGSVSEWKEREEFMEGKNNSLHMSLKVILNKIGNLKDLLYLQQTKLVPFIPSQINVNRLLSELKSDFQPLLDERNVQFSFDNVDSIEYMHNSPKRVKQVLFNLLHNAILYARKDQVVEVRVAYAQQPQREIIQFMIINMIDSMQTLPVASSLSMNMQNILLTKKSGTKMKKNKRWNLQTGLRVSSRILSVIGPKNSLQVKAVGTTLQIRFHIYADSSMQHANQNLNLNDSPKRNQEEDIMVDSWINTMDEYHKNNQNLRMERNCYDHRFSNYKCNTNSD